jgi:hypothetical protein
MHLCHDSSYRSHPFRTPYRPFAASPGRISTTWLEIQQTCNYGGGGFD